MNLSVSCNGVMFTENTPGEVAAAINGCGDPRVAGLVVAWTLHAGKTLAIKEVRPKQLQAEVRTVDQARRRQERFDIAIAMRTEGRTLREIGARLGISPEGARQVEALALRQLREQGKPIPYDTTKRGRRDSREGTKGTAG